MMEEALYICLFGDGKQWYAEEDGSDQIGPKKDDILTLKCIFKGYFVFHEYPNIDINGDPESWWPGAFRKIQDQMSISDELFSHAPEKCEA